MVKKIQMKTQMKWYDTSCNHLDIGGKVKKIYWIVR